MMSIHHQHSFLSNSAFDSVREIMITHDAQVVGGLADVVQH